MNLIRSMYLISMMIYALDRNLLINFSFVMECYYDRSDFINAGLKKQDSRLLLNPFSNFQETICFYQRPLGNLIFQVKDYFFRII